jgi:hypothetical protein
MMPSSRRCVILLVCLHIADYDGQKIGIWLGNNTTNRKRGGKPEADATGDQAHAPNTQQKAWSTQDVLKHIHKDRIMDEVVRLGGSREVLNFHKYNKAVGTIFNGLTDEEREEVEKTRKAWLENGPSDEMKQQ